MTETKPTSGKGVAFAIGLPDDDDDDDDPVAALLLAAGQPVTRETWIDAAYGADVPDPWTALEECELPERLQDWSKVVMED